MPDAPDPSTTRSNSASNRSVTDSAGALTARSAVCLILSDAILYRENGCRHEPGTRPGVSVASARAGAREDRGDRLVIAVLRVRERRDPLAVGDVHVRTRRDAQPRDLARRPAAGAQAQTLVH